MPANVMFVGAFLSTLFPVIGPAAVLLPAASPTLLPFVDALLVSVPAATLDVKLKLASAALARPEPPSLAVHAIETSDACHAPSAEPQLTVGALRSILLPVIGPAVTA